MVKCRAFIRKYLNSESTDNKENSNLRLCNRKRSHGKALMTSPLPSSHRPKWRRVCDDWVDRRLEDRQGVTTPVHVLYNTYLSENPHHYMDIAQFGKVLKSRFKNQKCRRGGQGAQIYVYKNVAIKSLDEAKADVSPPGPRLAISSDVTPPLPCSATHTAVTASPPRPGSATLSDVSVSPSRSATPADVRAPSPTQPTKRKASAESSIIPKKRKYIFEDSFPQVAPPASLAAESFVSRSEHSASPAAPSMASQQDPSEMAACGSDVQEPPRLLAKSQAPKYNLRPTSHVAPASSDESSLRDEEQHVSGEEGPVEGQGISCRMAVGRKWVDTQLRDEPGARTFAWEVAAAYARDHPDEPLPDTSIAVLIRNKFPSRRKAFKQGPVTTYYFQDLELVSRKGLCEVPSVTEHKGIPASMKDKAAPSVKTFVGNLPGAEASSFVKISEDIKPISVVKPPAQSILFRNGVPCIVLKVKPFIVRPSNPQVKTIQVGPLRSHGQQEDISFKVLHLPKPQTPSNCLSFQPPTSANFEDRGAYEIPFLQPEVNASSKQQLTSFHVKGKSQIGENTSAEYLKASQRGQKGDMSVLEYIQSEMTGGELNDNKDTFLNPSTTYIPIAQKNVNRQTNKKVRRNQKVCQSQKILKTKIIDDHIVGSQGHKSKVWDEDMRKFAHSNNQDAKVVKSNKKTRKLLKHCKDSLDKYSRNRITLSNQNWKPEEKASGQETEDHRESIKRTILETALNLFSEEGAALPEGERARRLEAALYERNPAVHYEDGVPWPSSHSEDAEEFPCRASQVLAEASALAQGDATQLLYHHQYCPGQGCSYNGELCLSLRAAYTHISIFRHRCHVWHCFNSVLALHASSCSRVDCPVQFCLFAKHELSSRGLVSWSPVEAERQLLRQEFAACERSGRHEARLHCHHRQRVQLPLPKPAQKAG
ncbi:uncharacterized protein [Penaeus vannamei]|uniref:uncharacterized protein isoform X2 n=1 Tax=Penaeus vannamei TaxID=6689 RepID=UPI00387F4CD9